MCAPWRSPEKYWCLLRLPSAGVRCRRAASTVSSEGSPNRELSRCERDYVGEWLRRSMEKTILKEGQYFFKNLLKRKARMLSETFLRSHGLDVASDYECWVQINAPPTLTLVKNVVVHFFHQVVVPVDFFCSLHEAWHVLGRRKMILTRLSPCPVEEYFNQIYSQHCSRTLKIWLASMFISRHVLEKSLSPPIQNFRLK